MDTGWERWETELGEDIVKTVGDRNTLIEQPSIA